MATYQILTWHGIPAGVKVQDEGKKVSKHLPQRFQAAIDAVAMAAGLTDSAGYMAGWRYADPIERPGTIEEVTQAMVDELVAEYSTQKLKALSQDVAGRLKSTNA